MLVATLFHGAINLSQDWLLALVYGAVALVVALTFGSRLSRKASGGSGRSEGHRFRSLPEAAEKQGRGQPTQIFVTRTEHPRLRYRQRIDAAFAQTSHNSPWYMFVGVELDPFSHAALVPRAFGSASKVYALPGPLRTRLLTDRTMKRPGRFHPGLDVDR